MGGRNHLAEGQMLGNWIKVTWPGINSQISTEIVWIESAGLLTGAFPSIVTHSIFAYMLSTCF